jgi:hypothetical protein
MPYDKFSNHLGNDGQPQTRIRLNMQTGETVG